jgi:hypothetical protein
MPMTCWFNEVYACEFVLLTESDNQAALAAVKRGYSRKLAYLQYKKSERISISALHEVYYGDDTDFNDLTDDKHILTYVPSVVNNADLGTKPLDHKTHWEILDRIGMRSLETVRVPKV